MASTNISGKANICTIEQVKTSGKKNEPRKRRNKSDPSVKELYNLIY